MATTIVNIKSGEPYDVYIGRAMPHRGLPGSIWANPFRIGPHGDRDAVVERYRQRLLRIPSLLVRLSELRGKTLACWCAPQEGFNERLLCHGQILAGLADGVPPESIG